MVHSSSVMARTKSKNPSAKSVPLAARLAKKSPVAKKEPKHGHRFKPGVVALREIKKQARSIKACIQRAPFDRLVRKRAAKFFSADDFRFSSEAMQLIQRIVEARAIECLAQSYSLTAHCDRDMLKVKDIAQREELVGNPQLAEDMRGQLCSGRALLLECQKRSAKNQKKAAVA